MFKLNSLFAILTIAILAVSCEKESLSPDAGETSASEEATIQSDEAAEDRDLLQLEAGIVEEEEVIMKAMRLADSEFEKSTRRPTVYTLGNEASGNEVIGFYSANDGTISEFGRFSTEGMGTDGGLGNQSALALSRSGRFLFATNAGSNELSFFYVLNNGKPIFIDKIDSGGERPVSVATNRGLIYVLNAGSDNISGFVVGRNGRLRALRNSTRSLSGVGTAPAQIAFKGNGRALVVTEKATRTISSFAIRFNGRPGALNTFTAANDTPFGFDFSSGSRFIASEAAGGRAEESTASTYRVRNNGVISLISGPLALNSSGACWVAFDGRDDVAYVTNTGSSTISSLNASHQGALSFANNGATTVAESGPTDAALDRQGRYLYVLAGRTDELLTYHVGDNGALEQIDTDGGLPDRATGVVVRR